MIYVLEDRPGAYKIGFTKSHQSLKGRITSLRTGHPHKLKKLLITQGDQSQEKALHRLLKQYRTSGEWFNDSKWMDPLMENTLALLHNFGASFTLSHTPDQIRTFCPLADAGPIPFVDTTGDGVWNPQEFAGHTVRSWEKSIS